MLIKLLIRFRGYHRGQFRAVIKRYYSEITLENGDGNSWL